MEKKDKIIVLNKDYDMPFSKGILARSLTAVGLKPTKSYSLAVEIENKLMEEGYKSIDNDKIRKYVYDFLILKGFNEIAEKYLLWRRVLKKHPIIILISGASGVGTSTIAFELASRLGIPSVIGTDSVREIMRKSISKKILPVLHYSSYNAWKTMCNVCDIGACDIELIGFQRHVEPVVVGIEGVIDRSLKEGLSVIIEGTHIIPSMISKEYGKENNIITITLTISSDKEHKKRFSARAKVSSRPMERYLENFKSIRKINNYLVKDSKLNNVPIIENKSISDSVNKILEIISERFEKIEKESKYNNNNKNIKNTKNIKN